MFSNFGVYASYRNIGRSKIAGPARSDDTENIFPARRACDIFTRGFQKLYNAMQWSCDGSQSSYKQRFLKSDVDDSFVFVLSVITRTSAGVLYNAF
jgi:hypothetical protein